MSETPPVEKKPDDRPFLGRAVASGVIRFLSVSQVKQFDSSQEGGCPARWAFQKIFGKKEIKTDAQLAGNQFAKEAEHYLTKGEDVLGPVMRAGKHLMPRPGLDLEVEKDIVGVDITKVLALRDAYISTGAQAYFDNVVSLAKLSACGIPFTGPFDFRHRRGEYIDSDGVLKREAEGILVCEIGDHKTTKSINSYRSKNGRTYPGYAKSLDQILVDPQMLGYGVGSANTYSDLTHTRLSHLYYQRENGYTAEKRTGLLTVVEVRQRWEEHVVPIVRQMIEVARMTRPEDVPKNLSSCKAFGKECPHAPYCPRPVGTVHDLLQISRGGNDMSGSGLFATLKPPTAAAEGTPANGASSPMGLFAGVAVTAPPSPAAAGMGLFAPPPAQPTEVIPAPPIDPVAYEAARQAARARFLAESAPQPPALPSPVPTIDSTNLPCGAPGCGVSRIPGWVISPEGGPGASTRCQVCNSRGERDGKVSPPVPPLPSAPPVTLYRGETIMRVDVPPAPPAVAPHIGAINPPDAPPDNLVTSSDPLTPEQIAAITNPELKARAEAHAIAWKEAQPAPAPGKEKTSGKCPNGGARVKLTQEQAGKKKYTCTNCGKVLAIKPSDDYTEATLPGHIIPKTDNPPVVATTAPPPPPLGFAPVPPIAAAPPLPPLPPAPTLAPIPAAPSLPPLPPGYVAPDALAGQTAMTVIAAPLPPGELAVLPTTMASAPPLPTELFESPLPSSLNEAFDKLIDTIQRRYGLETQQACNIVKDVVAEGVIPFLQKFLTGDVQ